MDRRAWLDELYGVAWDRFVETRDRLAGELARAGQKDESRELKKLKRPTPSAWATNQVVRRARAAVDDFLAAGDRLRHSQAEVVAGRGDPSGYQADVDGLRRATAALAAAARAALEAAGRGDDRHLVDRVVANVRAAALVDDQRAELLAGELTADLEAGDALFGGFASGVAGGSAGVAAPPAASPTPRPRDDDTAPARAEADAVAAARARRLADARAEEAASLADVTRAEEAVAAAHGRVDDSRAGTRAAEEAVAAARERARAADAALHVAEQELARTRAQARAAGQKRAAVEREGGRSP